VYAEPILPYVFVVLAFGAAISGFLSTKAATANRNLSMKLMVKISIASQVIGILFMVAWAMVDRSIWALVAGALVSALTLTLLSHLLLPGVKNRPQINRDCLKEVISFGKWIVLSSVLGFIALSGDRLLLANWVDAKQLGLYAIAFFMVAAVRGVLTRISTSVALPAFSEVSRERPDDLRRAYYKFRIPVDICALVLFGIFFIAGHNIIAILYDERYLAAGYMLEILSLSLIADRYAVVGQYFVAIGQPKLIIPLILARIVALFALVPAAFVLYGFDVALWVIGGHRLLALPVTFYLKSRHKLLSIKREIKVLIFAVAGLIAGWLINLGIEYVTELWN